MTHLGFVQCGHAPWPRGVGTAVQQPLLPPTTARAGLEPAVCALQCVPCNVCPASLSRATAAGRNQGLAKRWHCKDWKGSHHVETPQIGHVRLCAAGCTSSEAAVMGTLKGEEVNCQMQRSNESSVTGKCKSVCLPWKAVIDSEPGRP